MRIDIRSALCLVAVLLWPVITAAQVAEEPTQAEEWTEVASRAESLVERKSASVFALNRLREELFVWRADFEVAGSANTDRIRTVQRQISTLGQKPGDGTEESQKVALRRAELATQLQELNAPVILAQEAHARADGLIAEIDAQIRISDAAALGVRQPTPLNPVYWPDAIAALSAGTATTITDAFSRGRVGLASGKLQRRAPETLLALIIGGAFLIRWRRWGRALFVFRPADQIAANRALSLLNSLWQIVLPGLGLGAIYLGMLRSDVLSPSGQSVLQSLFAGGFLIVLGYWIAGRIFPRAADDEGPLGYEYATRQSGWRYTALLGIGLALLVVLEAVLSVTEATAISHSVVLLPINFLVGYALFRIGSLLRNQSKDTDGVSISGGRVRQFIGFLAMLVGASSPVLAAAGFTAAANAFFQPAVLTLATLAVLVLLQRFVNDIFAARDAGDDANKGNLTPILIGILLFLCSLPPLALAWGARVTDLIEVWERIRTGFTVGETTISPSDFITFAVVFSVGYLLTRFLQSGLRSSVLPRTKLDIGGQNAIVSGLGYVGILLAAIIAITSAGIDLSNLAIVAGALSVGIGFGLQNIVSNFVSGIILLIERPISEGDWIEVNGQMGYVRDISVRSTRIETFDRTDVIVPNADLISGQVTNWTRGNSIGRVIVPVGVAYGSDVEKVRDILLEIAKNHPIVLHNPSPSVMFMGFGASSLDFEIRAILRDINYVIVAKSEMNFAISRKFAEEGIEIPFPQQDIWLRNAEALSGSGRPATNDDEKDQI